MTLIKGMGLCECDSIYSLKSVGVWRFYS